MAPLFKNTTSLRHVIILLTVFGHSSCISTPIVRSIKVPIGRSVELRATDLFGATDPDPPPLSIAGEVCKVEVLSREPISMRVGLLQPDVFDCTFPAGSVTYTHFGSPQLEWDFVKVRVLRFTANETRLQSVQLAVQVQPIPYQLVTVLRQLRVKGFFGTSRPVDARVLSFRETNSGDCTVTMSPPGCEETGNVEQHRRLPARGRVVRGKERSPLETKLRQPCAHFLHAGIRYRHLMPPTPDLDFVPILIESRVNGSERVLREWIQLRVSIAGALPNAAPALLSSSTLLLEPDGRGGVAVLSPSVLSARDEETSAHCLAANDLIFNVSEGAQDSSRGYFYHQLDANTPVTSFWQSELSARNIFYRVPDLEHRGSAGTIFQTSFEVSIVDGDFAVSAAPLQLRVFVRPDSGSLPRLSVTAGLLLYEGQRRTLLPTNLRLSGVEESRRGAVRVSVVSGPRHGRLTVDVTPRTSFTWSELERGAVMYSHDDSDTTSDSLHLLLVDDPHALRHLLPVSVLPKDDSAPTLLLNLGLQVDEGRRVVILPQMLRAADSDSPLSQIVYIISAHPKAGHVLKSSFAHQFGVPVANFTQSELDDGVIVYAHAKGDILRDHFEVTLRDNASPTPNVSPVSHRVEVVIRPLDDDPPRPSPGATMSASLNETDLVYVTRKMLHYVDRNAADDRLTYTVTAGLAVTDGGAILQDAGKLVLLEGSGDVLVGASEAERYRLPEAVTFLQHHVNHNRLVYLSPRTDIGPTLLRLHFTFSVADVSGNHLHGQIFNITILPVNNKPPQARLRPLIVYEGNSSVLSYSELSLSDQDTPLDDLELWLEALPERGVLSVDGEPLNVRHVFGVADLMEQRVVYTHDGSEFPNDKISVKISDRVSSVVAVVNVSVIPVDDYTRLLVPDSPSGLSVNEGDYIMISQDVISAVDPDTGGSGVKFSIVNTPKFGSLLVGGNYSNEFTQDDLLSGRVQYVHSGREVGRTSQSDDIDFVMSDERQRSFRGRSGADEEASVHTLKITILPVDNLAPALSQRSPLRVPEGGSVALDEKVVLVADDDSATLKTLLVVARQPRHGHLENRGPVAPGSEISGVGLKIDSFGLRDLQERDVYYVQSQHRWMEPDFDSFVIYATDGIHRSSEVQFNVTITPENDETPRVFLKNFTVSQGGSKLIDSEILTITDLDRPNNFITVTLKTAPRHGHMQLGKRAASTFAQQEVRGQGDGGSSRGTFTHLSWEDFETVGVVYVHDGLSAERDNLTLLITDGTHNVQSSSHVDVTPLPHSRPVVALNTGLRGVGGGQMALVTATHLLARADGVPPSALLYSVERLPRHGVLQLLHEADDWRDVSNDGSHAFSQADVDSQRVRYVHKNGHGTSPRDGFNFVVSNGHLSTTLETFSIEIGAKTEEIHVIVTVKDIRIKAGERVVLGPAVITLSGKNIPPGSRFRIVGSPMEGRVVLATEDSAPIKVFTVSNFVENQVLYVHEFDDSDGSQDHFRLDLSDAGGTSLASAAVTILVSPATPPTIPTESTLTPSPEAATVTLSRPLTVMAGTTAPVALSSAHISSSRADTTYRILRFPQHGHLELDGLLLSGRGGRDVELTQRAIDEVRVTYSRRRGMANADDYFIFVVVGRQATSTQMEYRVDIVVETTPRASVRLELRSPETLEELGDGRQGFIFTDDHIRLLSPTGDRSVNYFVRRSPLHGRLERDGGGLPLRSFTPLEVQQQRIRYVLNADAARLGASRDTFEISVVDEEGINVALKSMELRWSIVYLSQKEYDVCEDVGILSISVERTSNLEHSSFVGIEAVGKSAVAGEDYTPSRIRQLQFDPGVSAVTWKININDDGRDENSIESFNVRLRNPVNAIIDADMEVAVTIHDKKKGSCVQSINSTKSAPKLQSGAKETNSMRDCDATTSGQSAQITYGTTNILLVCDGSSWVPRAKPVTVAAGQDGDADRPGRRRKNPNRQRNREKKLQE